MRTVHPGMLPVLLACAFAVAAPARARASTLPLQLRPRSLLLLQQSESGGKKDDAAQPQPAAPGSLDFDLLGEAKAPPQTGEDRILKRRRTMLKIHQGIGLGLVGLSLATTTVGQLNYEDKFGSTANTDKYRLTHATLAYTQLGLFVVNGTLALLTPDPPKKVSRGFDRTTLHKISMFTAEAGMFGQAALGVWAAQREGYVNQDDVAKAHLVLGYVTLGALLTGVSALVF